MQISIISSENVDNNLRNEAEAATLASDDAKPLFPPVVDLAALWRSVTSGTSFVLDSHYTDTQCFVLVERRHAPHGRLLSESRIELLERILLGQSQKAVAIDFQLAVSTVALASSDCLRLMGRNHLSSRVAALLVMAVHAGRGAVLAPARAQLVMKGRTECWLLSAPRPDLELPSDLTQAEASVTRLLVEGHPHARIAEMRLASPRTVANQLASAFRKLGISGRAELLSLLIRAGAQSVPFGSPPPRRPGRSTRTRVRLPASRRGAAIGLRLDHQNG
jgi:DNA-binding NarL/FixJ family response regulator